MGRNSDKRIKLGELLLRAGVITEEQLRRALAEQKKWGGRLGSILVDLGFLDEDLLVKALSKQLGLPRVDFSGLVVSPEALARLEGVFAQQSQVLPISFDPSKNLLVVAMSDAGNQESLDEIARRSGCRVQPAIAGPRALQRALDHYYPQAAVAAAPRPSAKASAAPADLAALIDRLEQMQRRQLQLLKSLVELLLQKGYVTREEYRSTLQKTS